VGHDTRSNSTDCNICIKWNHCNILYCCSGITLEMFTMFVCGLKLEDYRPFRKPLYRLHAHGFLAGCDVAEVEVNDALIARKDDAR
jgi:hypothetical protein